MRKLIYLIAVLTSAGVAVAVPPAGVPRKSPELIIAEPSGKTTLLSSLKGKVVVMEFLFIQSDHCIRVAKTLNKLNIELGAFGFQAVGIVLDPPNGGGAGERLIPASVNDLKLTYPVGYATKSEVDRYLGRTDKEILNIPQVIVIDRAGMIRAASGGVGGNPRLEDADSLRAMIDGLLKEEAVGGKSHESGVRSSPAHHDGAALIGCASRRNGSPYSHTRTSQDVQRPTGSVIHTVGVLMSNSGVAERRPA